MDFVTAIEAAILRATQFPEAYSRVGEGQRHIVLHRFPYTVVYETLENRIFILAVAHTSREPGYWKERS